MPGDLATETPPPDDPSSPLWLPALGAALFLLAGIWWLAFGNDEPKPAPVDQAASAAPSASASAAPSASAAAAQPSPH